jgi:Fe2+ transport system protein B
MPNQLHSPESWKTADRGVVEEYASGLNTIDTRVIGLARAELVRRDQEYAQEREDDRRHWEDEREQSRRTFEIKMFEAAGSRAAIQQEHDEKLARMQADAAQEAALIQAQATERAAERQIQVGRWSAAAVVAAAVAALLSLAVTVVLSWMK